jgi:predicted alpha-1,2-mannosidase
MTGRRSTITAPVAATLAALGALMLPGPALAGGRHHHHPTRALDPTRLVNPLIGTDTTLPDFGTGGSSGGTFPGASAPHGMLQWSPDTVPSTVNFSGGYTYRDTQLRGFSLTHLSGAGCASLEDVPILPTTAPVTVSPPLQGSSDLNPRYLASFDHVHEHAHPGDYAVTLNPGSSAPIGVELTTPDLRTGFGRFTFPAGQPGSVLVNAGGSALGDYSADVRLDPATDTITGEASSGEFCYSGNTYTVHFAIRFDRPFAAYGTWQRQTLSPGSRASSDTADVPGPILAYTPIPGGPPSLPTDPSGTAQTGAYVTFAGGGPVEAKVAISYVSSAGALANLAAQGPRWNLNDARRRAHALWQRALGEVAIAGGTPADRTTFYTALYHAELAPSVFDDVDGRYLGMDGQIHTAAGYTQYANFSGWDVYRTQFPLTAILTPRIAADEVTSLLADEAQSGWLPKWSLLAAQTNIEVGDPADAMIADAYALGARRFDAAAALAAMVKGATGSATSGYIERPALADYEQNHYIPEERNAGLGTDVLGFPVYLSGGVPTAIVPGLIWGPAAETLEYTADDFALARFAGQVGQPATCQTFLTRSGYWRSLLNPATGYLEPRSLTGLFSPVFDPSEVAGWVEGSTAQYTWSVPFDVGGLFAAMGGAQAATDRLDTFFTQLNAGPASPYAFLGNEPTLATPWLYDWSDPSRAQATVRRAVQALYGPGPTDYPGNDDLGTMASWVVFADLGLYPEIPGTDTLVLASPLFPRATLHLPGGTVAITGTGAADNAPYVTGLTLNGRPHPTDWLPFSALRRGGHLAFTLSRTPTGGGLTGPPPSYSTAAASSVCAP